MVDFNERLCKLNFLVNMELLFRFYFLVLWSMSLSSPVVGIYSIWAPLGLDKPSSTKSNQNLGETTYDTDKDNCRTLNSMDPNHFSVGFNCTGNDDLKTSTKLPNILRRIAFNTYALDLDKSNVNSSKHLESKFNNSLDLVLVIYLFLSINNGCTYF